MVHSWLNSADIPEMDRVMVGDLPAGPGRGTVKVVRGRSRIRQLGPALLALRKRLGQGEELMTSPEWFLSRSEMWDASSVVVLESRDGVLQSAVLLRVRSWAGLWTGVLKCGDLVGDGGVIAAAPDRVAAVRQAVAAVLARGLAHTVVATVRGAVGRDAAEWQARTVYREVDLTGGLEGFLLRQSRKFRRNFRYYRRRAEAGLGCRFLPELTAEQSVGAVRALYRQGRYPVPRRRAFRHEAAIRATPGRFAMGLVGQDGAWLGYLAGWRQGTTVYVEWQLNLGDHRAASLSTVMRSFAVEHEAARGARSLVFVGGTGGSWARACVEEVCFDLLATRGGVLGGIAAVLARVRPNGQVGRLYRLRQGGSEPGLPGAGRDDEQDAERDRGRGTG